MNAATWCSLRTEGAGLLALMVVAASGVTAGSRSTLGTAIESNGRGAYDLLVSAGSGLADDAGPDGLIEQNFAAFADTGGITLKQLSAIRRTDGVNVAAPLTFGGDLTSTAYGVLVGARDPAGAVDGFFKQTPQAFDVKVEISTSGGVQRQRCRPRTAPSWWHGLVRAHRPRPSWPLRVSPQRTGGAVRRYDHSGRPGDLLRSGGR